jgi:excisionase family DNA binding protein
VPTPESEVYLLTIQEVADIYLRTTPKAVRRLIERGCLPGVVHVGRRVLFRRDRLLQFLSESSVPSPWETKR